MNNEVKSNDTYIASGSVSERIQSAIFSMEKAYATMSKRAYYDPSLVSIKSGSQMESKWKEEIAKHASTGSSFDFVEAGNFDITMESETRGKASYTSVIRGTLHGLYQCRKQAYE